MARYPLSIDDQRRFPDGFDGIVHTWDIDKTYLATGFSSLKGLSKIPVEFAVDKRAIVGMPEVLRGLRRGPGDDYACVPIYFVSASPPQLRRVIERKMLLDGVEQDGIIFKDWLGAAMRLSIGRVTEQIGFKLCALLTARLGRPMCNELLYGDDAEHDAVAYDLYARLLAGAIDDPETRMAELGVARRDRNAVLQLFRALPDQRGQVREIFIHLETGTVPTDYERFEGRVTPVRGAVQLALALYQQSHITKKAVEEVLARVREADSSPSVDGLMDDALSRGLIEQAKLLSLRSAET